MDTILTAMRSVMDRLLVLSMEDRELRLRLRAVALEYLKATEDRTALENAPSAVVQEPPAASSPTITPPAVVLPAAVEVPPEPAAVAEPVSIVVEPAAMVVGMSPRVVHEKPVVALTEITDADLHLVETRCRLKMEGARWAATRRIRLQEGADFYTEIEPVDREIIEKARQLPDCFLWMCHPSGPQPADVSEWGDVAGCFGTVASGVGLVRTILDAGDDQGEKFEQALLLLAEAQSALRVVTEQIADVADKDQTRVYFWLKATAFNRQCYIPRYMRTDDPADPLDWSDLDERIGKFDSVIQQGRQNEKKKQNAFNRIRYHLKGIQNRGNKDSSHDWGKVITSVDDLIADGLPPSSRDLRDLIMPIVDLIPDNGDLPPRFKLVLREIDRFLATRPPPTAAEAAAEPSADLKEAARLLAGKTVVLIGGDRRPYAQEALKSALNLKDLDWIATAEHESFMPFEAHIARPQVAVVILAIRWSSHAYGEVRQFCEKYNKPLVRLPSGYNPNQVAAQVLSQCGERLRAS